MKTKFCKNCKTEYSIKDFQMKVGERAICITCYKEICRVNNLKIRTNKKEKIENDAIHIQSMLNGILEI